MHMLLFMPRPGGALSDVVWRLSVWRLSHTSVCRWHVRPACWMVHIGWSGSAGLAQGCRCTLPLQAWAGHIVAAAHLQLV